MVSRPRAEPFEIRGTLTYDGGALSTPSLRGVLRGATIELDGRVPLVAGVVGTDGGEVNWREVRASLVANDFSGWAAAEVRGGDTERLTRMAGWMRTVLGLKV